MSENAEKLPSPKRALVFDDNALVRMILASMLMKRGFEVIEFPSAEAALEYLREAPAELVMLDVMLTGMSGIELCQIIREDLKLVDLPVVAYTGAHDVTSVALMRMAGFNDFLFKPVDGTTLDNVLREVLEAA